MPPCATGAALVLLCFAAHCALCASAVRPLPDDHPSQFLLQAMPGSASHAAALLRQGRAADALDAGGGRHTLSEAKALAAAAHWQLGDVTAAASCLEAALRGRGKCPGFMAPASSHHHPPGPIDTALAWAACVSLVTISQPSLSRVVRECREAARGDPGRAAALASALLAVGHPLDAASTVQAEAATSFGDTLQLAVLDLLRARAELRGGHAAVAVSILSRLVAGPRALLSLPAASSGMRNTSAANDAVPWAESMLCALLSGVACEAVPASAAALLWHELADAAAQAGDWTTAVRAVGGALAVAPGAHPDCAAPLRQVLRAKQVLYAAPPAAASSAHLLDAWSALVAGLSALRTLPALDWAPLFRRDLCGATLGGRDASDVLLPLLQAARAAASTSRAAALLASLDASAAALVGTAGDERLARMAMQRLRAVAASAQAALEHAAPSGAARASGEGHLLLLLPEVMLPPPSPALHSAYVPCGWEGMQGAGGWRASVCGWEVARRVWAAGGGVTAVLLSPWLCTEAEASTSDVHALAGAGSDGLGAGAAARGLRVVRTSACAGAATLRAVLQRVAEGARGHTLAGVHLHALRALPQLLSLPGVPVSAAAEAAAHRALLLARAALAGQVRSTLAPQSPVSRTARAPLQ